MKPSWKHVLTIVITLFVLEWLLYVMEKHLRFHHVNLLRRHWYEYQYFAHSTEVPSKGTPKDFDPVLGWRNFRDEIPIEQKQKRRVLVFGDSFMYGMHLPKQETAPHFLQQKLGDAYEVINLAVPGYGIDQMVLAAEHVGMKLNPDLIVIGFIGADLERTCYEFQFNTRKPVAWKPGNVIPPYEVWLSHQSKSAKFRNKAVSALLRSRTVCLLGEFALTYSYVNCLVQTNLDWLAKLKKVVPSSVGVVLAHLDWGVPSKFEEGARALGFSYLDFPSVEKQWSEREKLPLERFADFHPKSSLNRLYAAAIANALHGVERTLSTNSIAPKATKFY